MPVDLDVGVDMWPPLTEREAGAVVALVETMRDSLKRRLPMTLELVDLEIELRRRVPLPAARKSRRERVQ